MIGNDTILTPVGDGDGAKALPVSTVITDLGKKAQVLLVEEEMEITVPGRVLYLAGDAEMTDGGAVRNRDGGSVYIIYQ